MRSQSMRYTPGFPFLAGFVLFLCMPYSTMSSVPIASYLCSSNCTIFITIFCILFTSLYIEYMSLCETIVWMDGMGKQVIGGCGGMSRIIVWDMDGMGVCVCG